MATEPESFCEDFGTATGMVTAEPTASSDLARRIDNLSRFDEIIAGAEGRPDSQAFWRQAKAREEHAIETLRREIGAT